MKIHPSAIVHEDASIPDSSEVGPFCVVGKDVVLGDNVKLIAHVFLDGDTYIGDGTVVYPFSTIGLVPQDLKYEGEQTKVIIGKRNIIRESVTIHRGTKATGVTSIGDRNLLMVGSHIAHDCKIGNEVILANVVTLAGYVEIENHVILGGQVGVHQFVRVGLCAMVGAGSMVSQDILPYSLSVGDRCKLKGLNIIGLKRRNFSIDEVNALKKAFKLLLSENLRFGEALDQLKNDKKLIRFEAVSHLTRFLETSKRGFARARD